MYYLKCFLDCKPLKKPHWDSFNSSWRFIEGRWDSLISAWRCRLISNGIENESLQRRIVSFTKYVECNYACRQIKISRYIVYVVRDMTNKKPILKAITNTRTIQSKVNTARMSRFIPAITISRCRGLVLWTNTSASSYISSQSSNKIS